jgi:hypothetical protein|tara:strand:+ start:434 stop:604 length:171 start_codon:yes stop_codon:yes gene_type:complete
MGPQYLVKTYNWFKTALWDAPQRLLLDIELEKLSIDRDNYLSGKTFNGKLSEIDSD